MMSRTMTHVSALLASLTTLLGKSLRADECQAVKDMSLEERVHAVQVSAAFINVAMRLMLKTGGDGMGGELGWAVIL